MTLTQILQKIKSVFYTKSEVDASLSGYLPKSGGQMTSCDISRNVNNNELRINGGTGLDNGASLVAYGKDSSFYGRFLLRACNGTENKDLIGSINGLTWDNKNIDVIEEQGSNYIRYTNGIQICWGSTVTTTKLMPIIFGKPFATDISYGVSACPTGNIGVYIESGTTYRTTTGVTLSSDYPDGAHRRMDWTAIGKWK